MGSENFKGCFKIKSKHIKLPVLGHVWSVFHHLVYNVDHLVGPPCKTLTGRFHSPPWTTHMLVLDNLQQNNCKHEYNTTKQVSYIIIHKQPHSLPNIFTYRMRHTIGICSEMCKDGTMNGRRKQVLRKAYTHDNVLTIYCTCTIVWLNQYLHGGKTQPNCQKCHTTTSTLQQLHFFLLFPGQHLNTPFKYRIKCNTANIQQTMAK